MKRKAAAMAGILLAVAVSVPAAAKEHVNDFTADGTKAYEIDVMSVQIPETWTATSSGAYQFFVYSADETNATIAVMEYGNNAKELNRQGKDAVIASIEAGMQDESFHTYSYVSEVSCREEEDFTAYSFEYDTQLQNVIYDSASYLFVPKSGETAFMLQYQYDTASAKDLDMDFARILDSVSFKTEEVYKAEQQQETLLEGDWLVGYTLDASYKLSVAQNLEKITFDRDGGFYINDVVVGTWDLLNTGNAGQETCYAMITSVDGDAVGTAMYGSLFPEISDEPQVLIQFYGYEKSSEAGYLLQRYNMTEPELPTSSAQTPSGTVTVTASQKNAAEKAKAYLKYNAYSAAGLQEQLIYEGFSEADAKYGVDNSGADWYEEAALYADAIASSTFFLTKNTLRLQLEYAGFTEDEIEYGLSAVGY